MLKNKYGNVYEILLPNGKYVYVCWIRDVSFGIFNYLSEKPTEVNQLLSIGFKAYKACKETAVRKKIWKLIGHLDLEKENIDYPDLVIFKGWCKEFSIAEAKAMRHGNLIKIAPDEYISLLKRGYIYGFFDDYLKFEQWLSVYLENYPENQDIFPLP